jgi:putative transposase
MEPSKAVKEYKEELVKSQKQNERLTALVDKVVVEKEWLAKKAKKLGSFFTHFFYSDFFV